ncbi:MAG: adenylate/guanylate cyclase domain-containing response regulator [Spirochaetales bacterium]|nr:adenylate/guanylate cyclase domain-containing response regulator [Spirochaetia bacterium]MDD7013501.1 adenylate/guanylate cyclase domain-containing response regulator [Spirochaetales bacterium]
MNSKNILVAFNSPTMLSVITNYLESQQGFSVFQAKDGIEALHALYSNRIDCALIYIELPYIQGYSLSRIIKNTKELSSTAVILCSTEDNSVYHFWVENSKSDGYYVPSSENLNILSNIINNALEKVTPRTDFTPSVLKEETLLETITSAYDKELFDLYIIKSAFQTSTSVFDINEIIHKMISTVSGIYNYDVLGIIVNDTQLMEFYDYSDSIPRSDFEDFRKICRSDFEKRTYNRIDFDWNTSIYSESTIEQFSDKTEKIKSYEIFPSDNQKHYPVTIHIGSCSPESFNTRTTARLNFFMSVFSTIIDKSLVFTKAKITEAKMRSAFSRFIPPSIIEDIISGDPKATVSIGEKRQVAILIADIRNFTRISENNKPETVVAFLNSYFTTMGKIIKKHGGTIDKFMGDSIMALFGATDSYKYNANRAANAAMEMFEEMEKEEFKETTKILSIPDDEKFSVGCGIHYGKPIVGAIGSEDKKEYTVIGDDVNLSSRVESLTKVFGTKIIVTEEVKKDIDAAMNDIDLGNEEQSKPHLTRHLANVIVKGKEKPTKIYEITSDLNKYSKTFLENYSKGLHEYVIKNFSTAIEYFNAAKNEYVKDKACYEMLKWCREKQKTLAQDQFMEWDGTISMLVK